MASENDTTSSQNRKALRGNSVEANS